MFTDSAMVTDSVIESGVRLGTHTNVLHILRTAQTSPPSQQDLFFNFEPDGDIVQLTGSLAFPDQAPWVLYPLATQRSWNGLIFDSVLEEPGISFHVVAYDTSSFVGFGSSTVNGHTLRTANMLFQMGESVEEMDSTHLTQNVHIVRTVKFAPEIGYFTQDTEEQTDLSPGPNSATIDLVLREYQLK